MTTMINTPDVARTYLAGIAGDTFKTRPNLLELANIPLESDQFLRWPASSMRAKGIETIKGHHCYTGGLLVHTAQVTRFALASCAPLPNTWHLLDVLVLASIWHDFGKIRDYSPSFDSEDDLTHVFKLPHAYDHHHIYRSAHEFETQATRLSAPPDLIFDVVHCVLSHHGRPEWGSPVEPRSEAAHILHAADMLSSRHYGKP